MIYIKRGRTYYCLPPKKINIFAMNEVNVKELTMSEMRAISNLYQCIMNDNLKNSIYDKLQNVKELSQSELKVLNHLYSAILENEKR